MGWLQGHRYRNDRQLRETLAKVEDNASKSSNVGAVHIEDVERCKEATEKIGDETEVNRLEQFDRDAASTRSFQDEEIDDSELPFISKEEVTSKRAQYENRDRQSVSGHSDLWIVIDNVVYNCSEFVYDHPGGEQVIRSFVGEDCSWQFWRFHGKSQMLEHGRKLRVGRTAGVRNRFPEAPRYVGLSRLGHDEW